MKQAQSETVRCPSFSRAWPRDAAALPGWNPTNRPVDAEVRFTERLGSCAEICLGLLSTLLYLVTLPFRLVFRTIAWVGRFAAIVLGFFIMVIGIALWAGPLFFLGIPLFLVGLVLTLKSLG
jgi:hypothetical protein